MIILLDTGVLGKITNLTSKSKDVKDCIDWFEQLQQDSFIFGVPEICDYELRRKLIHLGSLNSIQRLDDLNRDTEGIEYIPLETEIMSIATSMWAEARNQGVPTAQEDALDGDVILAATARLVYRKINEKVIIATTNEAHLKRFNTAQIVSLDWRRITPTSCIDFEIGRIREFTY